jgi:hypothetical protein
LQRFRIARPRTFLPKTLFLFREWKLHDQNNLSVTMRPANSKAKPLSSWEVGVHACYAVERSMYSEICSEVGLCAGPPAPEFLRILAIEKIAHSFSSGCILFAALRFIPAITGCIGRFGAAFRTVIRKARLARLQLKFFRADGTYFDRKFHNVPSILSEISFHTTPEPRRSG